ncbi:AraC family transcriptional regulator [Pontiella sp. NLcol2]|uniref:AraC family transcriptional regulator n=1 Tax=Pontiella agarivorans TaxID=3038953 RepID=A0ABU5N0D3_9BACT|nr:AraC family transcriptional regulator [Pontiella agarivorans]
MTHLSDELKAEYLKRPITEGLLCLRAGHHQAPPTHYLPRPEGSEDTIFIFCTDGRGWLEVSGKTHVIEKHTGFLIPAHIPHAYGADPDCPWSTYWTHFQGRQAADYMRMITPDPENPVLHLPEPQAVRNGFEQLYQQMNDVHTYTAVIAASGVLSHLLVTVMQNRQAVEVRLRGAEEGLSKTVEFMQRNLGRRLTLKDLSAVAGISPNHYATMFHRCYGHPPIDYFNRLKIQRACELLAATRLRISEVGELLGFEDAFYFSRLFKKIMGVSPRGYR